MGVINVETYTMQCLNKLKGVNQHTENARAAYKKRLYQRCDAQMAKAEEKIQFILDNPDLMDDNIQDMEQLARAFERLSIPLMCHHGIAYSNKVFRFPHYCNFASLCFYIQNVAHLYLERAQMIRRITGKKLAKGA